ncbi:hypothetical protein HIM_09334 [Hirsutella minnesotensis 3608]|uniref:Glycosyl transferase CAP10 domain-containing protein n=1 Tax=Hirsutella minnesotensis 3608 TaxID=1043627 RepID=A0A0F7ZGP7_9HYPO|nr:hypothetical protein HIM_09334 [Hirsutella minnesotensis 3608]
MSAPKLFGAFRVWKRWLFAATVFAFILAFGYLPFHAVVSECSSYWRPAYCDVVSRWEKGASTTAVPPSDHPIDSLILEGHIRLRELLRQRSTTIQQAAQRYRHRRGRHPPPGFDRWFAAARRSNAIVVEDFFDRIYHDVTPFWGLEPRHSRQNAHAQAKVIRVRDGKIDRDGLNGDTSHRAEQWVRLVGELASNLPDLDIPVNTMDESRILVPWETINNLTMQEHEQRRIIDLAQASTKFVGVDTFDDSKPSNASIWISNNVTRYWDYFAATCPPESPAHRVASLDSFDVPIEFPSQLHTAYAFQGFVSNFTASQDPCWQPHLRGMHSTFIESISMSTTRELVPMFGESKLPRNNEMLIPAAVYLDDSRTDYNGGAGRGGGWAQKKSKVIWRGVASGGRNRKSNWWHMHRNRFIQMLNGSTVSALEAGHDTLAPTFRLPSPDPYSIPAREQGKLGEWVSTWADAGFVETLCDPETDMEVIARPDDKPSAKFCTWFKPWFAMADLVPMKDQYNNKFLADIDGNSFSGRYRAFLQSSSMPIKSTIYSEWHDDRLLPWVHFAPMDNSFMDIYGLIDYFTQERNDAKAEAIAKEGQQWAETVLRREDMKLYTWRLLLEYARAVDDNRHNLAFVADLL